MAQAQEASALVALGPAVSAAQVSADVLVAPAPVDVAAVPERVLVVPVLAVSVALALAALAVLEQFLAAPVLVVA